jgi:hypothetical protein
MTSTFEIATISAMHRPSLCQSLAWTLVAASIAARSAHAQPTDAVPTGASPAGDTTEPRQVYVGMYVNQVDSINLRDSQVSVDFHVWFRWKGDDLKPIDTFDVVNGKIDSKGDIVTTMSGQYNYACCRVLATLHKLWDVSNFPLDEHTVTIEIEDEFEDFKLAYLPDTENCALSSDAAIAGWQLSPGEAEVVTHRYNTNYGDISLPTGAYSKYSRFVYSVLITRPGYGLFLKLFTGLFIATAIAFHAQLIAPDELDARLALAVGAMFAAVASEYVVVSALPESNRLTLADKLHILSFGFIFLSLVASVVSSKLAVRGHLGKVWWIDRACFVGLPCAYVITMAIEVLAR